MSIENELKLIPREEIAPMDILSILERNGYRVKADWKKSKQEDTYYDDRDKTLYQNNCSFRIRRKKDEAVVTCKIPVVSNTEYKQREEMELKIPEMYIQEDGSIFVEDAIDILKKEYPNIQIPENIRYVL